VVVSRQISRHTHLNSQSTNMPPPDEEAELLKVVGDYKHGSIRRVKLSNFLTYSDVEFSPGPRLNMVVGPNGTGKSTILCAICLGLGGEPRLLGRASDVETFVMHGETVGEIEIEVVNEDGPNPVIRRIIRTEGSPKSQFFWDGNSTTGKMVRQSCLKKYNISVDNLCTFLPQDRVGSFSGFDSKQLLLETEKALSSSQDLYHTHQELIEAQEALKGGNDKVETMTEKLEQMQAEQKRLEREKERMEQREIALEQAELLKKKIIWLKFDNARDDALEKKQLTNTKKETVKQAAAVLQPLHEQHAEAEDQLAQTDKEYQAMNKEIAKYKQEMTKQTKKYETHDDQIEQAVADLESMDAHRRLLEDKVDKQKETVETIASAMENFPSMETLEQEELESRQEHKSILHPYETAKRELRRINDDARSVDVERKAIQEKWDKMQDEKSQRRDRIFRDQPNLKKIHEWIQQNRQLFRKTVVGPIVCEITPKSRNTAAYIEQHLPNTVLKSFIVQEKGDYDLLYRKIRQEMKIPINIVVVENIKQPKPRMYSDAKMKVLKEEHGVVGWMDESFTAPDVVMEALRAHGVEKVLVGTDQTQQSLDNRNLLDYLSQPENGGRLLTCAIFSSAGDRSFKYTSTISKYSGKPSVRIDDVRPSKWLTLGVSDDAKERVQSDLREVETKLAAFGPAREETEKEVGKLEDKAQRANARVKKAKDDITNLRRYTNKLEGAKRKLQDLQKALEVDDDDEKQQKVANIKNRIRHSLSALEAQAQSYKKMMETTVRSSGMRLNREILRVEEERLRHGKNEAQNAYDEAMRAYQSVNQQYKQAKARLTDLKKEAEAIAPITDDEGNDLPLKGELEDLPVETLDEAEDALDEAIRKADEIVADPNVIRQYELRQKEMEQLQMQLDNLTNSREKQVDALKQKVAPWEQKLLTQVAKVDALFSVYMRELGCTGEVRLTKGNPDEGEQFASFRDWGVEIRVSFREGVKPQVLSARVQSGGERSVSTIMYLMAMQGMMVSPFRCVDEINQGLDERNERLVFKRIVANSTMPPGRKGSTDHCGQYFLITPKLLPNLYDMEVEAMTVLFIFNGPYNFKSPLDWDVDKLVAIGKRSNDEIEDEGNDENDENAGSSRNQARIPKRAKGEPSA